MNKEKIVHIYRIFFGSLIFVAIFYQLYSMRDNSNFNLMNYVSYFTVLSNLFVASVLVFSGIREDKDTHLDFARGAATLYILVTGLGFIFLLGARNVQLLPWVNIILHFTAPIVMFVDWFLNPLHQKISFGRSLYWIAPPIVYLGFAFVRGNLTGWYPYTFLDPLKTDVEKTVIYLGLTLFTALVFNFLLTLRSEQT